MTTAATSTEIVHRPEPGSGLARGKWEAPPWAFYATAGLVVVLAALYLFRRAGLLGARGAAKR